MTRVKLLGKQKHGQQTIQTIWFILTGINFWEHTVLVKRKEASEQNQQLKTIITRQIEGVNKAIDAAVYKLYGLSGEEVKVVEG